MKDRKLTRKEKEALLLSNKKFGNKARLRMFEEAIRIMVARNELTHEAREVA